MADSDSSLSQEILDISVTEVETIIEPDCVADDIWRKSVTFVCIHAGIVSQKKLIWQYPGLAKYSMLSHYRHCRDDPVLCLY